MRPKYIFTIAGLSVFTLGYCAGRGCRSDPIQPLPSPVVHQQLSPLEHAVQQPQQLPPPSLLPQQQLTPQEALLDLLASTPFMPPPPAYSNQQPPSFKDDCRSFLKIIGGCARQLYTKVHREARYCYEEAKTYVQELEGGK